MDPFAKKMVHGSFVFAAAMVLISAVLTVAYLHLRPRCSDQVVSSSTSPDGHWTASVMEARCGDESPFLTHVNLRPSSETIKLGYFSGRSEDGEVFLLEQDAQSASINLNWIAPDRLAISCSHCQIAFLRKRQQRWQNVEVTYFLESGP